MSLYPKLTFLLFFNLILVLNPFDLNSNIHIPIDSKGTYFEKSIERKLPKSKKRYHKNSRRNWGVISVIIGSYTFGISLLSILIFWGAPYFGYLLLMFIFALLIGLFLIITGIWNIDRSYINYADHQELKAERLKKLMKQELIFSAILFLISTGLLIVNYFFTLVLCLIAAVTLLTTALLKRGQIKRMIKSN